MGLTGPLFDVFDFTVSGQDLILLGGGLFLLAKSTHEIHNNLEGAEIRETDEKMIYTAIFVCVIVQIAIIDIVFSLDLVITAVIMMMFLAKAIGEFVDEDPTIKILAFSFLFLIGFKLMTRVGAAYSERQYLLRHGVLGCGRNDQYPYPKRFGIGTTQTKYVCLG